MAHKQHLFGGPLARRWEGAVGGGRLAGGGTGILRGDKLECPRPMRVLTDTMPYLGEVLKKRLAARGHLAGRRGAGMIGQASATVAKNGVGPRHRSRG